MSVILSNIPEEEDGQEGPAPKPFLSKASETWAKTLVQNDLVRRLVVFKVLSANIWPHSGQKNLSFDEQVKMMLEYEKDDKNLTLKKIERATKLHVLLFWNDAAGRRKTCDVVGMDKSVSVIAHQARAIARVVDGELVPTMEDMVETGLKLYVGVGEAPRELTEEDKEAIKNGTLLLTASKKSTASKTAKLPEAENKSNTSNGTASPAPDGGSPLLNGALGTPASTATPAPAASVAKTYTPPLGSLSKPPPKFSLLPSSSSSITFPAPLGPTSGFPPQIPFATSTPCTANPSSVLPPPRSVKRGSSSSEDAVEPKKRKTEQS